MEEEYLHRQQQLQEIQNHNVALRANIDQGGLDYRSQGDDIMCSDDFNLPVCNSASIASASVTPSESLSSRVAQPMLPPPNNIPEYKASGLPEYKIFKNCLYNYFQ